MTAYRFLLLEDSLLDAELAQATLTDSGINCELVRVETLNEFLVALEKESFDLILADYALYLFNGISALELAHNFCPAVPFIIISAILGEELAIETLKSGATDYVLKQRLWRLGSAVQRALREAQERKRDRAETALQQYKDLFQFAGQGLALMSVDKPRLELVNPAFARMHGYTVEELTGISITEVLTSECHDEGWKVIELTNKSGHCAFESKHVRLDGTVFPVFVDVTVVKDKSGNVCHRIVSVEDISQRQRAEAANRLKDEFLAVLSHELRSPLNPILGWAQLLRTRKFSETKIAEALAIIERNAKLQSQLIEDLLDVSRILQGKLSLKIYPVELVAIIEAALETVSLAAQAKSIQLQTSFEPEVGQVLGDPSRLQQVVWNLLSNAVKFTAPGGRVEVRLKSQGTQAQIQVCDTGKGINPEFLPHVFDEFRQADNSTTRTFGGLGLGLAIVRRLVEQHGGTVSADSPGECQGATFTVLLPVQSVVANTSEAKRLPDAPTLNGVKVLVVEDDVDSYNLLVFILEEYGASVCAVASVAEALNALASEKPDVLLSDVGMPEMDGYMLIRQLRAMPPEQGGRIPAIALTAYAQETDRQKLLQAGFQRHLTKPVEPVALLVTIASLLDNSY